MTEDTVPEAPVAKDLIESCALIVGGTAAALPTGQAISVNGGISAA